MIYEERVYKSAAARRGQFIEFYGKEVIPRLTKYGAKVIGAWETLIGDRSQVIILLAFNDMSERMKCWDTFHEDSDFNRQRPSLPQESVTVSILRPLKYSPMQ